MISTVFSARATVGRRPTSTAHRILFGVSTFMQMARAGPNRACVPAFCTCCTAGGLPSRRQWRRMRPLPYRVSCTGRDQTPGPALRRYGLPRFFALAFYFMSGCMPRSKAALSLESVVPPVRKDGPPPYQGAASCVLYRRADRRTPWCPQRCRESSCTAGSPAVPPPLECAISGTFSRV